MHVLFFILLIKKTAVHNLFINRTKECTQKQYHRKGANCFWFLFPKQVRNSLKYLTYHITDVFYMFRSKNHIVFYLFLALVLKKI